MGFAATGLPVGEWIVEQQWWAGRRHQMMTAVQRWAAEHAIAAGMPLETLRQQVGLPASELVPKLLDGTGLHVADGVVRPPGAGLPPRVDKPVRTVGEWLAADPFRAPEADELAELKLGPRELAAAVRASRLTRDELRERAARRVEELHLGRRWQPPTVVVRCLGAAAAADLLAIWFRKPRTLDRW